MAITDEGTWEPEYDQRVSVTVGFEDADGCRAWDVMVEDVRAGEVGACVRYLLAQLPTPRGPAPKRRKRKPPPLPESADPKL